jgi:hypothetical protein
MIPFFLLEEGFENAKNLKFLFCLFEQMSGLKINFLNTMGFCLGAAKENILIYEDIFTCKSGDLPMKYLGVPIH